MGKAKKRKRVPEQAQLPEGIPKAQRQEAAAAPAAAAGKALALDHPEAIASARPEQQGAGRDLVTLHRARFVPWQPTAVVASAVTADGSVLAVAQDSGAIELWETATWTCFQVVIALGTLLVSLHASCV